MAQTLLLGKVGKASGRIESVLTRVPWPTCIFVKKLRVIQLVFGINETSWCINGITTTYPRDTLTSRAAPVLVSCVACGQNMPLAHAAFWKVQNSSHSIKSYKKVIMDPLNRTVKYGLVCLNGSHILSMCPCFADAIEFVLKITCPYVLMGFGYPY